MPTSSTAEIRSFQVAADIPIAAEAIAENAVAATAIAPPAYQFGSIQAAARPDPLRKKLFLAASGILLAVGVVVVWTQFGSLEARMLRAAGNGQLVSPQGSSAYDLYQQLKAGGISAATREKLKLQLLPRLSLAGEDLLKRRYEAANFKESEMDLLVHIYEWAADLSPLNKALQARRAYAIGHRSFFKGFNAEAMAAFREAIQNDSQWALPLNDLGRTYVKAGDHGGAEYYYQQALQRDPNWVFPQLNLAGVYFKRSQLAEAEAAYRRASEMDSRLATPWYFLGQVHEGQRRKADAVTAYERAIELARQRPSSAFTVDGLKKRIDRLRSSFALAPIQTPGQTTAQEGVPPWWASSSNQNSRQDRNPTAAGQGPGIALQSWTGWITDRRCGGNGARPGHRQCALKCAENGDPLVLYTPADGRLLGLNDQVMVRNHAGSMITIEGTQDATGNIRIGIIRAAN